VTNAGYDLITMGRVGVDLYPAEPGPLATVGTFARSLGGTATNVAVAAARLGRRTAVVTKVGADPFGDYVRRALADFGVDPAFVGTHPDLRTPLAFCALDPPEDPPLLFYREPTAPDMTLTAGELPATAIAGARIFWTIGSALSAEPSRSAAIRALQLRDRRQWTIFDLDYRPVFWASREDTAREYRRVLPLATVVIGNRAEVAVAVGTDDPDTAADRLLAEGVELAVVKQGADGVLVATRDGRTAVPPVTVEVVCALGAGDAFGGAFCHGLLAGWAPAVTARFANAAGALVASRLACADAMPAADEVERVLDAAH
jgi:5-dehydro-2-deoxygluconokinase